MRRLLPAQTCRKLILLLTSGVLSLLVACDLRESLAPVPPDMPPGVGPLRAAELAAWGAERRESAIQLPVECTTEPIDNMFRYPIREMCGYLSQWYPISLEAGEHLLRVRLSGRLRMEGGNCSGWPTGDLGPLGTYWNGSHLPFMRTFVNWTEAGWYYPTLQFEPVTADSSVVEAVTIVSGAGSLGVGRFQPALYQFINHENACRPVGNVLMEVFVRDKLDVKPRLRVQCAPQAPVRGEAVSCSTSVEPAQAFTVISRRAVGKSNDFQVLDTAPYAHSAGESDLWSGPAIAPTQVRITAEVGIDTLRADAEFDVTRRPWTVYEITNPKVDTAVGPRMLPYLNTLGVFTLSSLEIHATAVTRAESGPNAGLAMLRDQPVFQDPRIARIYLHPALFPPPPGQPWANPLYQQWYADQNGNPPGSCDHSHMPLIRRETARHEGVTLAHDSHVGVTNRLFRNRKLHEQIERVYAGGVTDDSLHALAFRPFARFYQGDYQPAQAQFDTVDYQKIALVVGCSTDMQAGNP